MSQISGLVQAPPVRDYTGPVQNQTSKDLGHYVAAVTMVLLYFALQRQLAALTSELLKPFSWDLSHSIGAQLIPSPLDVNFFPSYDWLSCPD
uniref:(California timema) hypothetical protein n=1 Tax=Timema californicum TaxID=61474 RepID=A0A7R9P5W3_TIMCA|nr:unnamed protein product [Timema californicum]